MKIIKKLLLDMCKFVLTYINILGTLNENNDPVQVITELHMECIKMYDIRDGISDRGTTFNKLAIKCMNNNVASTAHA